MARRSGRAGGFVLVSVLWLLVLLAFVAAAMSHSNRLELRGQQALVRGVQARHLADGGVHLMLSTLLAARERRPLLGDGEAVPFEVAGQSLTVAVSDENGKVDINGADAALLARLLLALDLELDDRVVEALADAIVDFRDPDDLRHGKGAEDDDYLAAGLAWQAKDDWFSGVDELRQVLGMTDDVYRALLPYVTIYSGERGVNPGVAPLTVLRALSDDSPLVLQRYVEQRREFQNQGLTPPPLTTVPGDWLTNTRGTTFSLVATATLTEGARATVRAVVRLPRLGAADAVEIIEWRPQDVPTEAADADHQPQSNQTTTIKQGVSGA